MTNVLRNALRKKIKMVRQGINTSLYVDFCNFLVMLYDGRKCSVPIYNVPKYSTLLLEVILDSILNLFSTERVLRFLEFSLK